MADVNLNERGSFMATPTLSSSAGDRKVYKKKNLSWLVGAYRKIRPSESLSGITRQSIVMPISDPRADFPIRPDSYILPLSHIEDRL